ncbi:hypothetical protein GCM10022215_43400 [Nocardioides fonticola]|uniref:Thioredoxin domain-containing protein n=1 Tax=Nocardioides fonticola TaxID=450363 RepID=A0ABP7Y3A5_9ACTN
MTRSASRSRRRPAAWAARTALAAALLLGASGLAGCSRFEASGDKGYVSGDGTITTLDAADRDAPVELTGTDLDGEPLDVATYRGKPVVIVVWGAWCVECRTEADEVTAAAKELGSSVQFLGIDLRDNVSAAKAYERRFGVTWPSFNSPGGQEMLAFPGTLTPNTIPAFVVLDAEGRVAASIRGTLPSQQTLVDLAGDVLKESADASGSGGSGG